MKTKKGIYYLIACLMLLGFQQCTAQKPENWTADQLTEPATLAQSIRENKNVPVIFCVGPGAIIPNSINAGPASDAENLQKLKESLEKLPRDTDLVIYCGCCPFEHCPNVRPAIALLQEMKFSNYHLLNIPHNIKTDWIAKGYPQNK
jgi:hypothetical protein